MNRTVRTYVLQNPPARSVVYYLCNGFDFAGAITTSEGDKTKLFAALFPPSSACETLGALGRALVSLEQAGASGRMRREALGWVREWSRTTVIQNRPSLVVGSRWGLEGASPYHNSVMNGYCSNVSSRLLGVLSRLVSGRAGL